MYFFYRPTDRGKSSSALIKVVYRDGKFSIRRHYIWSRVDSLLFVSHFNWPGLMYYIYLCGMSEYFALNAFLAYLCLYSSIKREYHNCSRTSLLISTSLYIVSNPVSWHIWKTVSDSYRLCAYDRLSGTRIERAFHSAICSRVLLDIRATIDTPYSINEIGVDSGGGLVFARQNVSGIEFGARAYNAQAPAQELVDVHDNDDDTVSGGKIVSGGKVMFLEQKWIVWRGYFFSMLTMFYQSLLYM